MNNKQIENLAYLCAAAAIIGGAVVSYRNVRNQERAKRKQILDEMGLDVAAIHNATDVVNARIERGEIRNIDQLKEAVLTEVAFQKMVIREK